MKKLILSILMAVAVITANAQTISQDGFKLAADALAGPWGVLGGFGRSVTGTGKNLVFGVVTYNVVPSTNGMGFNSGAIGGVDYLWGDHGRQQNDLNGGWNVSYTGKPLAFVGKTFLTNVVVTAMAYQLVATPRGGGNIVGAITGTAVSVNLYDWNNFYFKAVGLYENRNGEGYGNGNWLLAALAVSHNF